jgi:hypothetical protein
MASRDETLQEFLAITGITNDATARQLLDSCDWSLQPAVELFFATSSDLPGGTDAAAAVAAAHHGAAAAMDAHRRRSFEGGGAGGGADGTGGMGGGFGDYGEDGVRAPMPTKVERLYGDHHHHHHGGGGGGAGRGAGGAGGGFDPHAAALHGLGGRGLRSGMAAIDPGPQHIDAFRPPPPPAAAAAGGDPIAAATAAAAAATAAATADNTNPSNLAALYEPPTDLIFQGGFDDALESAAKQSRWLLVNVQTGLQFASHRLNRDTWRHPLVSDVVRASFVFWQAYDTSIDGGRVARSYNLSHALPAVVVVDPITRAAVWSTAARRSAAGAAGGGFVEPETLLEELAPFTDVGPCDPDAAALAARHERRVKAAAEAMAAAAAASGGGGGGAGDAGTSGGAGTTKASVPAEFMTEDEQLAAALAESAREAAGTGGAGGSDGGGGAGSKAGTSAAAAGAGAAAAAAAPGHHNDDDDLDEQAIWEEVARREAAARRPPPEQVVEEARARLPAEPAGGGGCRVAVRLPDGQRVSRVFDGTKDKVACLRDLCLAHCPEAAGGRAFALSEALPGSVPLREEDNGRTLAEAGLANVQLVLRWVD